MDNVPLEWSGFLGVIAALLTALFGQEPIARWWERRVTAPQKAEKEKAAQAQRAEEVHLAREDAYIAHLQSTVNELTGSLERQLEEARQREIGLIEELARLRTHLEAMILKIDALEVELSEVQADRARLRERLIQLGEE